MTAALSLLAFVGLATLAAQRWLVSARWTTQGPGLAIWAWQALSLSVAAALLLAGFTLILPLSHLSVDLAGLLRACAVHLRERYVVVDFDVLGFGVLCAKKGDEAS